jgi:hypothetical protein
LQGYACGVGHWTMLAAGSFSLKLPGPGSAPPFEGDPRITPFVSLLDGSGTARKPARAEAWTGASTAPDQVCRGSDRGRGVEGPRWLAYPAWLSGILIETAAACRGFHRRGGCFGEWAPSLRKAIPRQEARRTWPADGSWRWPGCRRAFLGERSERAGFLAPYPAHAQEAGTGPQAHALVSSNGKSC